MAGCDPSDAIHTVSDCLSFIHTNGFIPLFSNTIPWFSVEEHTAVSQWWTGDPETDPWEWRQILSSDPTIAYGKFFGRNAGFISKEWFPAFANYRRNGYDFDALFEDELASYRAKKIMDVFELDDESVGQQIMSNEVKQLAGFSKDGGEKNFEGCITDLQMQTYLIMGDFRQKKNKKGVAYGWHIAVMETPETKWGREFVTSEYTADPVESWEKIVQRMKQFYPEAGDEQVKKLLGIRYPGVENRTEKKMEEISIKFGKGLAEPFTGKDGKEYMRILIPNQDKGDHTPWASFVLPAKSVHENKYGKGLWAKIPADGTTTVTKAVQVGEQDGKRIWENQKTAVPNRELKARVEAYKSRDRESARGKLEQLTAQVAEKLSPNADRPRARAAGLEK